MSWGWGLRGGSGWRSEWPKRHRWDSTDFAELLSLRITVQTYPPVVVDVGMEHFGDEADHGRLGGVLLGELELEFKESAVPCGALRAFDEGRPVAEVAFLWGRVDALVLLVAQLLQVADQSLLCRVAHTQLINSY